MAELVTAPDRDLARRLHRGQVSDGPVQLWLCVTDANTDANTDVPLAFGPVSTVGVQPSAKTGKLHLSFRRAWLAVVAAGNLGQLWLIMVSPDDRTYQLVTRVPWTFDWVGGPIRVGDQVCIDTFDLTLTPEP
jgi:hypothetical protein